MSDTVHVRSESGALLYFAGAALPPGIADRIRKGDLVRVTEDGEPWNEAAETAETLADAKAIADERDQLRERVRCLEAQLAELLGENEPAAAPPPPDDGGPPPDPAGGAAADPGGEPPPGPSDAPPLPSVREARAVWTDFAIGQGMDRAEANAMTKAQLIERLTTAPPAP